MDKAYFRQLAELVADEFPFDELDFGPEFRSELIDTYAADIAERFGTAILPERGESLSFSIMNRKIAALAFDRVYRLPGLTDPVPDPIAYYTATKSEIAFFARGVVLMAARKRGIRTKTELSDDLSVEEQKENEVGNFRFIGNAINERIGVYPSLIYSDRGNFDGDFVSGSRKVLMRTFSDVCLVEDEKLQWDQILEFRSDVESKQKYRRFIRWIDNDIANGRSESEIVDTLDKRIEDYNWSIKKHGLEAGLGAISAIVDPKALAASGATAGAAGLAAGPIMGLATGAGISLCQGIVKFGEALVKGLDDRKKDSAEIAYIHDVKRKLGR